MASLSITRYSDLTHRSQVIALWEAVFGYDAPHNKPGLVIDKKLAAHDDLFFVATAGDQIVGTLMAGYDGHRGWMYSVAVDPAHRKQGIGSQLVSFAEQALTDKGCVKINLQILEGNEGVTAFYTSLGYSEEKRISMGKLLSGNVPGSESQR
jgi:ribosomal protein S18 acetylase RimI-like enzyme